VLLSSLATNASVNPFLGLGKKSNNNKRKRKYLGDFAKRKPER